MSFAVLTALARGVRLLAFAPQAPRAWSGQPDGLFELSKISEIALWLGVRQSGDAHFVVELDLLPFALALAGR